MLHNSRRLLDPISIGLILGSASQERRRSQVFSTAVGLIASLVGCGGTPGLTADGSSRDVSTGAAGDTGTSIKIDSGTGADGNAAHGDTSDADAHVAEVGTEAPGHCSSTNDHASIRVYLEDGSVSTCDPSSPDGGPDLGTADGGLVVSDGGFGIRPGTTRTLKGMITGGDATSLVIDSCDGNPNCVPNSVRIEISAPGIR